MKIPHSPLPRQGHFSSPKKNIPIKGTQEIYTTLVALLKEILQHIVPEAKSKLINSLIFRKKISIKKILFSFSTLRRRACHHFLIDLPA